ncbi:hypothetical protein DFR56_10614 [Pseudogracilibacillus auburnensis]|uniref:Uncharacterized protein n=1 Tax=Pseudogracilibacillus auburnensis TaxID=1494959 RepID=A0A2V3W1H2_9BACI|nr:hypothetical protein DFR56_10614 [Pseudogracilibacillus auburnensis]
MIQSKDEQCMNLAEEIYVDFWSANSGHVLGLGPRLLVPLRSIWDCAKCSSHRKEFALRSSHWGDL